MGHCTLNVHEILSNNLIKVENKGEVKWHRVTSTWAALCDSFHALQIRGELLALRESVIAVVLLAHHLGHFWGGKQTSKRGLD